MIESDIEKGSIVVVEIPVSALGTSPFLSHPYLLAFILRGLKEFGEPTRKALIMDLAPDDCTAGMFGLYYLIRDVFVSIAAFGGAFLWQISPETNFFIAFLFGVAGTFGFTLMGKDFT